MKISFPVLFFVSSVTAQKGYIYVHVSALNEESSSDFQFSVNGGITTVPDFYLNDQPLTAGAINDIGAGHGITNNGTGDGELWLSLQAGGQIYHRVAGSSRWLPTGYTGTSLDGAGPGQFVHTTAGGDAYFFDGNNQQLIYTAMAHGGVRAVDITYGDGRIAIVTEDGAILTNNITSAPYTDAWTTLAAPGTGASRLDMRSSSGEIVYYSAGSGAVFTLPFAGGTAVHLGTPGTTDVAYGDDGVIYANGYNWNGVSWSADVMRYTSLNRITAGVQVWATSVIPFDNAIIFSRTTDGSWIDDERVTPAFGNAIILPVEAGNYALSAVIPAGWALSGYTVYSSGGNSVTTPGAVTVNITVTAGETVHIIAHQAALNPVAISQACGVIFTEDFGAGSAGSFAATSYHYHNTSDISDGYYAIQPLDQAGQLTDHTSGTGNMLLVKAGFHREYFYRKRLTNLLTGQPYKLSFWVANINPAARVKPDIQVGMVAADGSSLTTFSTGAVTSNNWREYTFTFIAPASTADIYLRNNVSGIDGNYFALDDIAIIPMAGVLPASMLNPSRAGLCEGSTAIISNGTPDGRWSTNNPAVATVDATGRITAVSAGYADITYTVTDVTGCEATAIHTLPVYTLPDVMAVADKTALCPEDTVHLEVTARNTPGPYTYKWTASPLAGSNLIDDQAIQTTAVPTTSGSGYAYIAVVTDARGCTASGMTDTVILHPLPVATISYTPDVCKTGVAAVMLTGTAGGTYTGTPGLIIDSLTGSIDLTNSTAGAHQVTYTFSNGQCSNVTSAGLTIHDLPEVAAMTASPDVCAGDQVQLQHALTGGVWRTEDNAFAIVSTAGMLQGIAAGTVNVRYIITNEWGCADSTGVDVVVNPLPQASIAYDKPVFCVIGTADVRVTGTAGGTFSAGRGLVINPQTGAIDLAASRPGTYTVSYSFTEGKCGNTTTTVLAVEALPVVAAVTGDNMVCIGNESADLGSLTPGGVWISSDVNIMQVSAAGRVTAIAPGNAVITYQVTTVNGCSNKADFAITVPPMPEFTATTTPTTCSSSKDGSITIPTPGNGYKYSLNGEGWLDENTFSGLRGGDYSVQVMNEKNCVSAVKTVKVPAPLDIALVVTPRDVTCHGESSGAIALSAAGGTPPYRVMWSTGATNNRITNLPAGDYSVTVTDQNGCASSLKVRLTELFPVFVVDDPVKQEGGLLRITGTAIPRANILVTYPDGSITTTHTDVKGNFSTLSPNVVETGTIVVTVTDPASKGNCTKVIDYRNSTSADLSVIKSITIAKAPTVGDLVTFTLTVNNKGLDHATQVIVTDDVSGMLDEITDMTATGGYVSFNPRTRQVVWNIDTLYVNKAMQLSFSARILYGGRLENSAIISGREMDPDLRNNESAIQPVEISPDLFIPNVVTANGDGKNDYFLVRGIDQYPGSVLEIYNRWGSQVYRSGNYANNWGGAGLASGIYYYVLKINMARTTKVYKGYIELIQK
ncbi:T9SS type B sorting domain-containing protein [Chitinophaga rhizophila]|uniref:Gliding motility-associated C-terminal domain-containing protein n=1 Tax=Chitinophaga rhizophila TaxID=2866212 RepID=A0ABS7GBE6_9BACT|nr:gliding motility-associated C-terminal domain-containing protein [Chitinophaga rhizophila]MBW8684984.1 gliding motility-associated C-terminal domain-containing protein [Chitinophaga rhizophila]